MIASMPHFYNADPKLLEGIEEGSLMPNKTFHELYVNVEIVCFQIFK